MRPDPLRFHHAHRAKGDFGDGIIQRGVSAIAEAIGTPAFLIVALALIIIWIMINGGYAYFSGAITALEHGKAFDAAPWVLLNLVFSFEAFFTGSLVVIAAKAQAKRELAREEADAKHREELAQNQLAVAHQHLQLSESLSDLAKVIADRLDPDSTGGIEVLRAQIDALQADLHRT